MFDTLNRIERELNEILLPSCHKVKLGYAFINKKQKVISVLFTVFTERGHEYTFVRMPKVKLRVFDLSAEDQEREERLYAEQFSTFRKALNGYVEQ